MRNGHFCSWIGTFVMLACEHSSHLLKEQNLLRMVSQALAERKISSKIIQLTHLSVKHSWYFDNIIRTRPSTKTSCLLALP